MLFGKLPFKLCISKLVNNQHTDDANDLLRWLPVSQRIVAPKRLAIFGIIMGRWMAICMVCTLYAQL